MDSDNLTQISEGKDSDDEPLSLKRAEQTGSAKKTLKEVVIPPSSFTMPVSLSRTVTPSQSPSSDGSALSSVRDQSSEYDTPGTSTAVTPAESLGRPTSLAGLARKTGRGNLLQKASQISVPTKRKHEDLLEDALLARALQEEEYQVEQPIRGIANRRGATAIEDSDDDDDLDLLETDEADSPGIGIQSSKRQRVGGHSSLPARAARESAQKSVAENVSRSILDTDSDDLGLSEYGSDEDIEDFNGSDVSEDEISVATGSDHQATTSTSARRRPTRSTRRRPTRPTRTHNWRRNAHASRVRFFTH